MRRGHASNSGWRNENSRHFRPRSGFSPHFRHTPRNFSLLETPRFAPPGPRPPRGPPPFSNPPSQMNWPPFDHHDRTKLDSSKLEKSQSNQFNLPDTGQHRNQRSIFPFLERFRHKDSPDHGSQFNDNNYYNNSRMDPSTINSMGDVDHRQGNRPKNSEMFGRQGPPPWSNRPDNQRRYYDDRNDRNKYSKQYRHDNVESTKIPTHDYPGHRPPASDHYGGNPSSSIDNSNSFSRSVDDTVDIIRRRLQNRNDPQPSEEHVDQQDEDLRIPRSISSSYQNTVQEQLPKKRIQRQRQEKNAVSNCDKMKSKIVQQLFKMDKDRIHKLMDNPSSSSKFEYAIDSLINESQNSLNKHMRSLAEKSLTSSEDFIHNDNNTIYEDTFMKQMQNILEPQDTVLLEDIKPLVLAELSKVLQLDEYDQPFQLVDDSQNYQEMQEQHHYDAYGGALNYDNYPESQNSNYDQTHLPPVGYEDYGNTSSDLRHWEYHEPEPEKPKPLFERRSRKKSDDHRPELTFSPMEMPHTDISVPREEFPSFANERRSSRRSIESKQSEDKNKEPDPQVPLFDTNTSRLSDDEDPFAELDKQYHVAVDPNFIELDSYGTPSPQQPSQQNTLRSKDRESNLKITTPVKDPINVKQEIDDQLHDMALSPLKMQSTYSYDKHDTRHTSSNCLNDSRTPEKDKANIENETNINIKQEFNTDSRNVENQSQDTQNTNILPKAIVSSSSRKRSIDQKPSHRKEKRKKSESESSQQVLNKNVNNTTTRDSDKCNDAAKSIYKLFYSKKENAKEVPKDTKKVESVYKPYSDKYVKRKETQRKSKENEDTTKKRQRSLSTSHSIVSPKDSTNNNTKCSNKTDSKTKFQSFDMFTEQPKKVAQKPPAHRNTAPSPNAPSKPKEIPKTKQTSIPYQKITKKHAGTQACLNKSIDKTLKSQITQTVAKKMVAQNVQTDPVTIRPQTSKATDVFERMKEIDMEIQVLLQEKFKLYSSLESNSSCPSTIQTLGMTVLNVPLNEVTENVDNSENALVGDAIVEDFTNIPVEELEQIALESVGEPETPVPEKKSRRHKVSEESRASSASPSIKGRARKAAKTPNISLLEQIITDDRPLEDIISLDDLETTPVKTKKKPVKQTKKSHKKTAPKGGRNILASITEHGLKECYVVLERKDFSWYFKKLREGTRQTMGSKIKTESIMESVTHTIGMEQPEDANIKSEVEIFNVSDTVVEETVVENDLQFDMLDVSEDIVIGEMCEMKSEDKEAVRAEVSITEDLILDNSQSSMEPVQFEAGTGESICKMYDYSTDDNLRRDAISVTGHAEAVLAIECIENNFVAACLDGNVYYFSGDGQLLSTLRGSNLAVTCLTIVKEKYGTTVYTGSLDSRIRYFDLETGLEKGPECNVLSPIQTMDRAWDTIFVGTRTGFVLQFECKNNMLIPVSTVKFSDQSILALRAMKEGPRKVLLVASRSEDVTIKDAQTGLLLRSLQGPKMTVYTLLYEEGKIYCGTSTHLIHVFDYTSGVHVGAHTGGKGAVCLRAAGGLVFAGCYDGCVYVFREGEPRALAQLRGPGLMLLSLAVVGTKIIAGYKDRSLYIWKIPLSILQEMIL